MKNLTIFKTHVSEMNKENNNGQDIKELTCHYLSSNWRNCH